MSTPSLTLFNQTVLTSLPGHSSILKCHEFTKKGFYFVFPVSMHISKSFLYFVSLSNLHTQNTLKLHDDFNLLHDPILHPVLPISKDDILCSYKLNY